MSIDPAALALIGTTPRVPGALLGVGQTRGFYDV
jgi:hypothetical protein